MSQKHEKDTCSKWWNLPFDTYHIWWGKAIKEVGLDIEN